MSHAVSSSTFRRYVRELRGLNADALRSGGLPVSAVELARGHLNGRASGELRAAVHVQELRRLGAFFTGDRLASAVVAEAVAVGRWSKAVDPACGCGDLLLAAAWGLPVNGDLPQTLRAWGSVLAGADVVPEFVEVARQRLMLLAILRGAKVRDDAIDAEALLPGLVVADGRQLAAISQADLVLLNPPYGKIRAPADCGFTSGLTTEAALFTQDIFRQMVPGTRLSAILPDVLRSGTRYGHWREHLALSADLLRVTSAGRFDALTDVDVFVLHARKTASERSVPWPECHLLATPHVPKVSEVCSVHVGPVVDRRDPEDGPLVPYITTRDLPQGGVATATNRRRFDKRLFAPPFVVLRRTSRPSDVGPRLRPVTIVGDERVAVENHLVVLVPHDQTLRGCARLMDQLGDSRVTAWLNERIRCRHLTVRAIRDAPLSPVAVDGDTRL